MTRNFDLIVLGTGSAGLTVAQRAARHGAKVALFDPDSVGGTCVNRGCVPKKALWYAAQWAHAQGLARDYGFDLQPGRLDWAGFRARRDAYIGRLHTVYDERLASAGVDRFAMAARLLAVDTVQAADGERYRAGRIVIATGARPRRLELPGFDLGMVSDDVFGLPELPARIGIVGAGYVAVEFACLLQALGTQVELLIRKSLLDSFEPELTEALSDQMLEAGIGITPESNIVGARGRPGAILLDDANGSVHGPFEAVLWAVGRTPNSDQLGLAELGVAMDSRGHVLTDAFQNTSVPGIAALGDVTDRPALTPVAVSAGYALAERLFGGQPDACFDYAQIPTVVFAEPPLGMVGLTEVQARALHGDAVHVHHRQLHPAAVRRAGAAAAERDETGLPGR